MGSGWPALVAEYEAAVAGFENVSQALTAALVSRNGRHEVFEALLRAEQDARDAVTLTRMRLLGLWRETYPGASAAALSA
jgi:hypothetical protein